MPVNFMPAPGPGGNAAGGVIGPQGAPMPATGAGGAGGGAAAALDGLAKAYMMAKLRKPPPNGIPPPGAPAASQPNAAPGAPGGAMFPGGSGMGGLPPGVMGPPS